MQIPRHLLILAAILFCSNTALAGEEAVNAWSQGFHLDQVDSVAGWPESFSDSKIFFKDISLPPTVKLDSIKTEQARLWIFGGWSEAVLKRKLEQKFIIDGSVSSESEGLLLEASITEVSRGNRAVQVMVGSFASKPFISFEGCVRSSRTGDCIFRFKHKMSRNLSLDWKENASGAGLEFYRQMLYDAGAKFAEELISQLQNQL